jgi:hypothetical protein
VPDFSVGDVSWEGVGMEFILPPSGPVRSSPDKDHPYISNQVVGDCKQLTFRSRISRTHSEAMGYRSAEERSTTRVLAPNPCSTAK